MSLPTLTEIGRAFRGYFLPSDDARAEHHLTRDQAENLCQIADPKDLAKTEEKYYQCAQALRGQAEYATARSILHSLAAHSADPSMKKKAKETLFESLGDVGGWTNLLASGFPGGGPLREWGDEEDAGAVWDVLVFGAASVGTYLGIAQAKKVFTKTKAARDAWNERTFALRLGSGFVGVGTANAVKGNGAYPYYLGTPYDRQFDHRHLP